MKIRFVDLPRQNKVLKKKIMRTIESVVTDADFILGPRLEKFEKEFARFCGKKYAVGVNSGTDALKLALLAYGIGKDDEVITAANSYFSSGMVIAEIGAKPVLVDIMEDTHTIDLELAEKAITKKTKAIIPVHLYGQACDMDKVLFLAKKYGLVVVEDACQAHGATYKGITVPVGDTGAFSFYPGKNLGCFGDGGAIVTDDRNVYEKCLYLRNDGAKTKYIHQIIGTKSRLDTLQAAVLSLKLPYVKKWNKKRREMAKFYVSNLKATRGIKLPIEAPGNMHVYHLFVIECKKRDALSKYLLKNGIQTVIHYPIPIHLQKGFQEYGYKKGYFPVTEKKANQILSLPMFPEMTESEARYTSAKIRIFAEKFL